MNNERPRVVIAGIGGYGRLYVDALTNGTINAELAAVVDTNPDLYARFPVLEEHHIPLYTSLSSFFSHDHADLVFLVTPVHYHRAMAEECFRNGANVLCEKPLCLTIEDAEAMQKAADDAGKLLALGYQHNYRRDVRALKQDILDGKFGKPLRFGAYHGYRRGRAYYGRNNWAGHITVNGLEVLDSPFANACAHVFQMLTFLLGDSMDTICTGQVKAAELYRANSEIESYDMAALRYETDSGAQICYFTSHQVPTLSYGPAGVLEFEHARITFEGEQFRFHGMMDDGSPIDYPQETPLGVLQKLADCISLLQEPGSAPLCKPTADYEHIKAVRALQAYPVKPIKPELLTRYEEDGDSFLRVAGLEEALKQGLSQWKLPSELGFRFAD